MPREFTGVFTVTVYIPPDANRDDAANSLKDTIEDLKNKSPDHLFIVTGDFNHCNNLNISDFHQFINVPTREDKTLDLFFCNVKSSYKCYSKPPLGSSDHQMILLLPKYRPVLRLPQLKRVYKFGMEMCVRLCEAVLTVLIGVCLPRRVKQ
ncbi:endonuclease domain of the non-LTR retrotransposon LINE-1 [Elysia marginata]|uniref:Endonuclease domain of the non-LTR retrotransposon LINE-1 n=1 Tax=Elysia marginata TaxID=1093978 RepID=A0AAV4FF23_9GAST|nr:endonuclease domain of the non-LTR retrotransposon LINE-1 [Elysia marginata]